MRIVIFLFVIIPVFCQAQVISEKNPPAISQPDTVAAMEDTTVYIVTEEEPAFPGGPAAFLTYLGQTIKYPALDKDSVIAFTITVSFIVEKDGSITYVRLRRPEKPDPLTQEVIRVFNEMPNWEPGKMRGKKVRTSVSFPVRIHPK